MRGHFPKVRGTAMLDNSYQNICKHWIIYCHYFAFTYTNYFSLNQIKETYSTGYLSNSGLNYYFFCALQREPFALYVRISVAVFEG